jgi:hypothetical protein
MIGSGLRAGLLALAIVGSAPAPAQAQTRRLHLGPRLGYEFSDGNAALGAQLSIPVARRLEFYPSFDYYFIDPGSLWTLNGDFKYRVAHERPNWLYVGSGLNFADRRVSGVGSTHAGLNLLAGVESLKGWVHPFGEARLTISDDTRFQLQAGLNFTLGGHGRR